MGTTYYLAVDILATIGMTCSILANGQFWRPPLGTGYGREVVTLFGETLLYRREHMILGRQIKVQSFMNWIRRNRATV